MKRILPMITGLALIGAGVAAIKYDKAGAELYGFPTNDAGGLGMSRASGARDIVMGAMLLAAPKSGRNLLFAVTLVSIFDVANVGLGSDQPNTFSLAVHGSGIVGLLLFALITPAAE
jgi:hypothetical protein